MDKFKGQLADEEIVLDDDKAAKKKDKKKKKRAAEDDEDAAAAGEARRGAGWPPAVTEQLGWDCDLQLACLHAWYDACLHSVFSGTGRLL
jgi:hypothetical protein